MRITTQEAQAWSGPDKLEVKHLDEPLLGQVESQIMARLGAAFDTSTWIDETSTPPVIRSVIAMQYMSFLYHRAYSEDEGTTNSWANRLQRWIDSYMEGLLNGTIDVPGVVVEGAGQPVFYPNDNSSAMDATWDDSSLGDAKFSMGRVF